MLNDVRGQGENAGGAVGADAGRGSLAFLERLAGFIRSHGFPATIGADSVTFSVPCVRTLASGLVVDVPDIVETVRTFGEARDALGY